MTTKFTYLTPEVLRLAQSYLSDSGQYTSKKIPTTCNAIDKACPNSSCFDSAYGEACNLINEQHGTLWPFKHIGTDDMTKEQIQGGRFMYLELLALAIEDGCL